MPNWNMDHPDIDLGSRDKIPTTIPDMESHDDLLAYLTARLDSAKSILETRRRRLARIDKTISTWQKLSPEDTERRDKQETTGTPQAISINLPLVQTHLDDMVSFFAAVYSPTAGDFFQIPDPKLKDTVSTLVDKLNSDAKETQYFTALCSTLRSLLKYNVGGHSVEWVSKDGMSLDDNSKGLNRVAAIDMYNIAWDTSIKNPTNVAKEAEWAATFEVKNRPWIVKRELDEYFRGVSGILDDDSYSNGNTATYYRDPPVSVNISPEDEGSNLNSGMDWKAYGLSLDSENPLRIDAFEITTMYCWIDAKMFDLRNTQKDASSESTPMPGGAYSLWKFIIIDGKRIVFCQPSSPATQQIEDRVVAPAEIPYYLALMNQDDMMEFTKSIGEMLAPFQNYASFLLNAHIANTRSNIYGIKGIDPMMFDASKLGNGQTAAILVSKQPGRDVRTGLSKISGEGDTSNTMAHLQTFMQLIQQFFPAQALPNQIAGMDRAINSQVQTVMQGVNRRLHMLVRLVDDGCMVPSRARQYKNIVDAGSVQLDGLNDAVAARVLGNGLMQLNREAAENAMRQLIFAIIQNQAASQQFSIPLLMDYWAGLMAMNAKLSDFIAPAPAPAPETAQPPTQGAPGGAPAA